MDWLKQPYFLSVNLRIVDNIAIGPGFGGDKPKLCVYHTMGDGLDGDTTLLSEMDFLTTDTLLYLNHKRHFWKHFL